MIEGWLVQEKLVLLEGNKNPLSLKAIFALYDKSNCSPSDMLKHAKVGVETQDTP